MAAKTPEEAKKSHYFIDPKTGFCAETKTFHSLRPNTPLPPSDEPLSVAQFTFSLFNSAATTTTTDKDHPSSTTAFLVDSTTGKTLTYSQFIKETNSLSLALRTRFSFSKNDVAFILCPPSFHVPILYFSLLSLGVTVSPANPLGSNSEVTHQINLCKPKIAFATTQTAHKLPVAALPLGTVLIDSPEFLSFLTWSNSGRVSQLDEQKVGQSDPAAILYSSGTTGKVKGVCLTHRNLIALIAGFYYTNSEHEPDPYRPPEPHPVSLFTLPLFHVFGFFMLIRAVSMGETLVLMERFDFEGMLRAVERYKITHMPVSPPLIVALVKSDLTNKYHLSSLLGLGCGGAPLGEDVAQRFREKFPHVEIIQ